MPQFSSYAYKRGYHAGYYGYGPDKCPYSGTTEGSVLLRRKWANGFETGRRAREFDDAERVQRERLKFRKPVHRIRSEYAKRRLADIHADQIREHEARIARTQKILQEYGA